MARLDALTDPQVTLACGALNVATGGGRAAEQARVDTALDAQVQQCLHQGTGVMSQVPWNALGYQMSGWLQDEITKRIRFLRDGGP